MNHNRSQHPGQNGDGHSSPSTPSNRRHLRRPRSSDQYNNSAHFKMEEDTGQSAPADPFEAESDDFSTGGITPSPISGKPSPEPTQLDVQDEPDDQADDGAAVTGNIEHFNIRSISIRGIDEHLRPLLMTDPRIMRAAISLIDINHARQIVGDIGVLILAGHCMESQEMSFDPEGFKNRLITVLKMLRQKFEDREELGLVKTIDEILDQDEIDAAAIPETEKWRLLKFFVAQAKIARLASDFRQTMYVDADAYLIDLQNIAAQIQELNGEPSTPKEEPADPFLPFPVDLLPDPVATFVRETAASKLCDPAMVALPALAVLGGAIGTTRQIQLKEDWREFPIIWAAVICESGTRKTPVFEAVVKPLKSAQRSAHEFYEQRMQTYKIALSRWESQHQPGHTPDPGENRPPPQPPVYEHIFTSDTTVEAVTKMLASASKGVTMVKDELSDWLGNMNKYARTSNDAAKYLEWFGGHASKIDRKTADPIFVKRGTVCITGTIQPATFWRCFTTAYSENGFLARFLLAYPPVPDGGWSNAVVSPETEADWNHLVMALRNLGFQPSTEDFEEPDDPIVIPLTTEALEKFASFCNELEIAARSEVQPALRAAISKMTGYTAKFALIDYLVPHAPPADVEPLDPPAGHEPVAIDDECIEAHHRANPLGHPGNAPHLPNEACNDSRR